MLGGGNFAFFRSTRAVGDRVVACTRSLRCLTASHVEMPVWRGVITVKLKEIGWWVCEASARGQRARPHSLEVESPGKIWVSVGTFRNCFPHLLQRGGTSRVQHLGSQKCDWRMSFLTVMWLKMSEMRGECDVREGGRGARLVVATLRHILHHRNFYSTFHSHSPVIS